MLSIILDTGQEIPLDYDGYCIEQNTNGWEDKLKFTLPLNHPQAYLLSERVRIWETTQNQVYAISSISNGKTDTAYEARLDLDSLCAVLLADWNNFVQTGIFSKGSQTMEDTIKRALSDISGWSLFVMGETSEKLAIENFFGTPLELVKKAVEVWPDYTVRLQVPKSGLKLMDVHEPGNEAEATETFFSDELNLRERPSFKGKAESGDSYYTELRLYGKDGIYVDVNCHDYDKRVIWHTETDSSIEDTNALKLKADKMIKSAAFPSRSYSCNVIDLYEHDKQKYPNMEIELYKAITLMDSDTGSTSTLQIAQKTIYPYYPEKNQVQLNTVAGNISKKSQKYSGRVIEYTDSNSTQAEENEKETV